MSDLIDRQAAIDAADKIIERDTSGSNAVVNAMIAWSEYIKTLPSAQPEIIYCKHCKHRTFHDNRISSEQCYVCDYWDFDDPQPNGFCNFAERREE